MVVGWCRIYCDAVRCGVGMIACSWISPHLTSRPCHVISFIHCSTTTHFLSQFQKDRRLLATDCVLSLFLSLSLSRCLSLCVAAVFDIVAVAAVVAVTGAAVCYRDTACVLCTSDTANAQLWKAVASLFFFSRTIETMNRIALPFCNCVFLRYYRLV